MSKFNRTPQSNNLRTKNSQPLLNFASSNTKRCIMRNLSKYPTFVFDLDNTLVETNIANNLSCMEAIKEVLNEDFCFDSKQRFTRDKLLAFFPGVSQTEYNDIIAIKKEKFNSHIAETTLNTNLVRILKVLSHHDCETILLTHCRRERAMSICSYYNIAKYFTALYFFEDEIRTKYDVLLRNGYNMESIILFENESDGKEEAIRNGIISENIIGVKF